jgi:kexin
VEVEIVSPNGISSILGGARSADLNTNGYPDWIFMSVKHWLDLILFSPLPF